MKIKEYLKQSEKLNPWDVILYDSDVNVCKFWDILRVNIIELDLNYITDEDKEWILFTLDKDGNPKNPTVFKLEKDLLQKKAQ